MILIISNKADFTSHEVCRWLDFYKEKYILVDDYPKLINVFQRLKTDEFYFSAIWFRKHPEFKFNFDDRIDLDSFLNSELDSVLDYIYSKSKAFKLSCPSTLKLNKLKVLDFALENELSIPEYILSDSKKELQDFSNKHNGKIISKSILNLEMFEYNDEIWIPYTIEASQEYINEMKDTFFPSFFQKKIDKLYEIRSFFLDGKFYTAAIMSQESEQTKVDFRKYDKIKPNRVLPYSLPKKIEQNLNNLMLDLSLNTGSIDLLFDANEKKYYFLEVNPNGQIGMISKPCNFNLERKIADLLISKSS